MLIAFLSSFFSFENADDSNANAMDEADIQDRFWNAHKCECMADHILHA